MTKTLTLTLNFAEFLLEYRPLEMIKDNYPKYVATLDPLLQQRNGIVHINLVDFIKDGKNF